MPRSTFPLALHQDHVGAKVQGLRQRLHVRLEIQELTYVVSVPGELAEVQLDTPRLDHLASYLEPVPGLVHLSRIVNGHRIDLIFGFYLGQ